MRMKPQRHSLPFWDSGIEKNWRKNWHNVYKYQRELLLKFFKHLTESYRGITKLCWPLKEIQLLKVSYSASIKRKFMKSRLDLKI